MTAPADSWGDAANSIYFPTVAIMTPHIQGKLPIVISQETFPEILGFIEYRRLRFATGTRLAPVRSTKDSEGRSARTHSRSVK